MEGVAIGVGDGGVPHVVADEGFSGLEAAGTKFVVEGDGIPALEPDGGSDAAFFRGDAAGIVFLKHDGRAAEFQPAPDDLVGGFGRPFVFQGEAEAVDVEAEGARHVRDHEEGNDLLDVGTRVGSGWSGHVGDRLAQVGHGAQGEKCKKQWRVISGEWREKKREEKLTQRRRERGGTQRRDSPQWARRAEKRRVKE